MPSVSEMGMFQQLALRCDNGDSQVLRLRRKDDSLGSCHLISSISALIAGLRSAPNECKKIRPPERLPDRRRCSGLCMAIPT